MIAEKDIDSRIAQLREGYGLKYEGRNGPISLRPVCVGHFPFLLEFCHGSSMHGRWLWVEELQLRQLFRDSPIVRRLPKSRRFKTFVTESHCD